ncbi:MAG: sensor histidine kinase [Pseudomonadota bacterium]
MSVPTDMPSDVPRGRDWSLRRRLAWQLALTAGAVLALLFVLLDTLIDREIYAHLDQGLTLRAEVIAHSLQRHGADLPLADYQEDGHTEFYTLFDRDGRVLATSPNSHGLALPWPAPDAGALPRYYDARLPDGHAGRLLAQAQVDADGRPGVLAVGTERAHWDSVERRVHMLLASGIALALVVVVLLSLWLVGRSFGLLERLRTQVAGVDADTPARLPDDLPAELHPFAQALQAGMERLRLALQRERRFARDVAHELRTPVAEIRASAEAALPQVQDAPARAALQASLEASQRMQRSIESLLTLARIESGLERPSTDPFDLGVLLRTLLGAAAPRLQARALQLAATLPASAWCLGDAGMLERLASNLLDNAIEYAPAASQLQVHLWRTPDGWRLVVGNAAPGLAATEVAHFGERFWRREGEGGTALHAGLGLALCRALADALAVPLEFALEDGQLQARIGPLPAL